MASKNNVGKHNVTTTTLSQAAHIGGRGRGSGRGDGSGRGRGRGHGSGRGRC